MRSKAWAGHCPTYSSGPASSIARTAARWRAGSASSAGSVTGGGSAGAAAAGPMSGDPAGGVVALADGDLEIPGGQRVADQADVRHAPGQLGGEVAAGRLVGD